MELVGRGKKKKLIKNTARKSAVGLNYHDLKNVELLPDEGGLARQQTHDAKYSMKEKQSGDPVNSVKSKRTDNKLGGNRKHFKVRVTEIEGRQSSCPPPLHNGSVISAIQGNIDLHEPDLYDTNYPRTSSPIQTREGSRLRGSPKGGRHQGDENNTFAKVPRPSRAPHRPARLLFINQDIGDEIPDLPTRSRHRMGISSLLHRKNNKEASAGQRPVVKKSDSYLQKDPGSSREQKSTSKPGSGAADRNGEIDSKFQNVIQKTPLKRGQGRPRKETPEPLPCLPQHPHAKITKAPILQDDPGLLDEMFKRPPTRVMSSVTGKIRTTAPRQGTGLSSTSQPTDSVTISSAPTPAVDHSTTVPHRPHSTADVQNPRPPRPDIRTQFSKDKLSEMQSVKVLLSDIQKFRDSKLNVSLHRRSLSLENKANSMKLDSLQQLDRVTEPAEAITVEKSSGGGRYAKKPGRSEFSKFRRSLPGCFTVSSRVARAASLDRAAFIQGLKENRPNATKLPPSNKVNSEKLPDAMTLQKQTAAVKKLREEQAVNQSVLVKSELQPTSRDDSCPSPSKRPRETVKQRPHSSPEHKVIGTLTTEANRGIESLGRCKRSRSDCIEGQTIKKRFKEEHGQIHNRPPTPIPKDLHPDCKKRQRSEIPIADIAESGVASTANDGSQVHEGVTVDILGIVSQGTPPAVAEDYSEPEDLGTGSSVLLGVAACISRLEKNIQMQEKKQASETAVDMAGEQVSKSSVDAQEGSVDGSLKVGVEAQLSNMSKGDETSVEDVNNAISNSASPHRDISNSQGDECHDIPGQSEGQGQICESEGQSGGESQHEGQGQCGGKGQHEGQGHIGGKGQHEGQGHSGGEGQHEGQGHSGGKGQHEGQGHSGGKGQHEGQGHSGGEDHSQGQSEHGDDQGQSGGQDQNGGQGHSKGQGHQAEAASNTISVIPDRDDREGKSPDDHPDINRIQGGSPEGEAPVDGAKKVDTSGDGAASDLDTTIEWVEDEDWQLYLANQINDFIHAKPNDHADDDDPSDKGNLDDKPCNNSDSPTSVVNGGGRRCMWSSSLSSNTAQGDEPMTDPVEHAEDVQLKGMTPPHTLPSDEQEERNLNLASPSSQGGSSNHERLVLRIRQTSRSHFLVVTPPHQVENVAGDGSTAVENINSPVDSRHSCSPDRGQR